MSTLRGTLPWGKILAREAQVARAEAPVSMATLIGAFLAPHLSLSTTHERCLKVACHEVLYFVAVRQYPNKFGATVARLRVAITRLLKRLSGGLNF